MWQSVFRVVYAGLGTAAALTAWGFVFLLFGYRDTSVREQFNAYTLIVVSPILVVYLMLIVGLIRGRWQVWRWLVPAILVAGVIGLSVMGTFYDAGRAYEPEPLWWVLWWGAPVTALLVVLGGELVRRRQP